MFARLSVDTDALRSYGRGAATHAEELRAAAALLATAGRDAAGYGPVGAGFLSALGRAVDQDAGALVGLGAALTAAQEAAGASAQSYDRADMRAADAVLR